MLVSLVKLIDELLSSLFGKEVLVILLRVARGHAQQLQLDRNGGFLTIRLK